MKKANVIVVAVLCVLSSTALVRAENEAVSQLVQKLTAEVDASPAAGDQVKAFVKETLLPLCTNPVFVSAVNDQNARGLTLDEIKKIDEAWINAEDELPIHAKLTGNKCADELRKIATAHPAIAEAFVMDNQGANVGQIDLTSDYWQGDEAKWQNSYKEGNGGIDVGKNKLDRSTNRTMQQVSLPIIDENGHVIGAVTFGIAVESL